VILQADEISKLMKDIGVDCVPALGGLQDIVIQWG
jgi:hypothetical protein